MERRGQGAGDLGRPDAGEASCGDVPDICLVVAEGGLQRPDRAGELIEFDVTQKIFTRPKDKRTEDYVTGRFG